MNHMTLSLCGWLGLRRQSGVALSVVDCPRPDRSTRSTLSPQSVGCPTRPAALRNREPLRCKKLSIPPAEDERLAAVPAGKRDVRLVGLDRRRVALPPSRGTT